jgi:hypothetical protein
MANSKKANKYPIPGSMRLQTRLKRAYIQFVCKNIPPVTTNEFKSSIGMMQGNNTLKALILITFPS